MNSPSDFSLLSAKEKDALIAQLLARLGALERENATLKAENATLREKLNLPPKTPDNSSTPPAAGHKSNGARLCNAQYLQTSESEMSQAEGNRRLMRGGRGIG